MRVDSKNVFKKIVTTTKTLTEREAAKFDLHKHNQARNNYEKQRNIQLQKKSFGYLKKNICDMKIRIKTCINFTTRPQWVFRPLDFSLHDAWDEKIVFIET